MRLPIYPPIGEGVANYAGLFSGSYWWVVGTVSAFLPEPCYLIGSLLASLAISTAIIALASGE